MKFITVSDVHYVAPSMIIDKNEKDMLSVAVCNEAFKQIADMKDIDTVLITGDITDDGDIESHKAVIEKLYELQKSGKKVYVITATHDFHHNEAYILRRGIKTKTKEEPWNLPHFNPDKANLNALIENYDELKKQNINLFCRSAYCDELWDLYYDFGPKNAFSVCENAYSYCVDIDETTRCLMLNDSFRNEEATKDKSVTYSPECLVWIEKMVDEAKKDGKVIFACTHHPLVPPSPSYRIGADNRDMRSSRVGHKLADMGINLVFSGHTHFRSLKFLSSDNGNVICDITTPSLRFLPPEFRIAKIDNTKHTVKCETVEVNVPDEYKNKISSLKEYYTEDFKNWIKGVINGFKPPLNKIISNLTVKQVVLLFPSAKQKGFDSIKNNSVVDILLQAAINLQAGDGAYTPDTPEYAFLMGLSASLDSIIDSIPFVDVKQKILKGYSVKEVMEPMLYNNSVPDGDFEVDYTRLPDCKKSDVTFTSHAGDIIVTVLWILSLALLPVAKPLMAGFIPLSALYTKFSRKKRPTKPERY